MIKVKIEADLPTDSANYEVLEHAVSMLADDDVPGLTCEIGLRRGGGSKVIMDALQAYKLQRVHIAIDPYGNIEYPEGDDNRVIRCDYTNEMRDECLINMHLYCRQHGQSFIFFNLEDTEFFARYADGVPVYAQHKQLVNEYALVHFDGPHTVRHLKTEIDFFHPRAPKGAVWVFDDVKLYNHNETHEYVKSLGWSIVKATERKWSYTKIA